MADWSAVARRAVIGLGVQPGELILVRDHAGRSDLLGEVLLAIEQLGATPLPEIAPPEYVLRLLASTDPKYLATWDRHWQTWITTVDRVITLPAGGLPGAERYPAAFAAWLEAQSRLSELEESRNLPNVVLMTPTEERAARCGMTLPELEALLLPAASASAEELQGEIGKLLAAVGIGRELVLRTGDGCELRMALGDREWHSDDGVIDAADRLRGSIVTNIPAGSIYTTVVEDSPEGRVWLEQAGPARDVTLYFVAGRVARIEAAAGAAELGAEFDRHSGEPRRVSHIGIGLNPYLTRPIGWTLIDEHVHGAIFLALGENRYMGGQNQSSLNVDYTTATGTILIDGRPVVEQGRAIL